MKYLVLKWFYIRQVEPYVVCDVDKIPARDSKWSERSSSNRMEQVRELLRLIDRKRLDRVIVATNFKFWWVQPCKERAHPGFEF